MSDAPEPSGLTTDSAPTGSPPSSSPADSPTGGTPDLLAEPPADRAVFDRGYVESVRREAQRYRTEAQETKANLDAYEQVFGVYDPEDRKVWMDLATTWAHDPNQAAAVMQQIATTVLGEPVAPDQGEEPATMAAAEQMFGPDQIQSMIDEALSQRDMKAQEQRQVDEVFNSIRTAGLDPSSADGMWVLHTAANVTGGDIAKALGMLQDHRQKIIDDYVQGRSSGRVAMPSATDGVTATATSGEITSIEDARRATDAFLRERRGAS